MQLNYFSPLLTILNVLALSLPAALADSAQAAPGTNILNSAPAVLNSANNQSTAGKPTTADSAGNKNKSTTANTALSANTQGDSVGQTNLTTSSPASSEQPSLHDLSTNPAIADSQSTSSAQTNASDQAAPNNSPGDATASATAPALAPKGITSDDLLTPIRIFRNYVSNGYQPSIEWDRTAGVNTTIRSATGYSFYIAGPIGTGEMGRHFSTWIQGAPIGAPDNGFWNKFVNTDLRTNWGDSQQFVMLRGGIQADLFEGGGLGLADRTASNTTPYIWNAINGYNPTQTSRGLSLEYTMPGWTTAKTFMFYNQPSVDSGDPTIQYQTARGVGCIFEKLLDKTTTSSLQLQSVFGYTPTVVSNANFNPALQATASNPIDQSTPVRFQRWNFMGNKAFNDSAGHERVNAMFGLMIDHERNFIGLNGNNQTPTVGYGYTFELLTIPIVRHLAALCRYNQFRSNNHETDNTLYAYTVGLVLDIAGPPHPDHFYRWHGKMTFDYQITGQHAAAPTHQFILGWWTVM